jgi:glucose/arabinose dehydrogenase
MKIAICETSLSTAERPIPIEKEAKVNARQIASRLLMAGCLTAAILPLGAAAQSLPPNSTLYASGLQAPRGLRFGPDGNLYVAEAGTGGSNSTGTACTQVPAPVGPYTGGPNARISKISSDGTRTTVASGFPSTQDAMGDLIGVADVVFLDDVLYAVVAGGGCSHGNPNSPSGIAKVNTATGQWTLIADIGAFLKTHPTKHESPDDFEPDGTLYSAIADKGKLFTVEPNHGEVLSVTPGGDIRQVIDISASEGHIVPTSIAERNGSFYVGNLNLFPIDPQWARILTISRGGYQDPAVPGFDTKGYHIVNSTAGFTTVVAVDFGPDGLIYALELSDQAGNPALGAGKVVRVTSSGEIEDVVTGLSVPTGMTFGPDGALYVSNFGAAPAGAGQILRITIQPGS